MIEEVRGIAPTFKGQKYVHYSAVVIGDVSCKRHVSIWPNAVIRADENQVLIGEYTNIQDGSVLHIELDQRLVIGDYVTIGHNVNLHACKVGDYSLVGIGAIVLSGAIIGENCLIAAGSVVPPGKVIPDNSLFLKGEIKPRTVDQREEHKKHAEHYWELAKTFIKTSNFL
ncbi:MAG: gamma carbonic anhydrase family protein [Eubacteriales bacterium]